jgi:NAD-dependent SIR2 family protein deacetylase
MVKGIESMAKVEDTESKKLKSLGFTRDESTVDESTVKWHLKEALHINNLLILTGAGTSIIDDDSSGKPLKQIYEALKKDADYKKVYDAAKATYPIVEDVSKNTNLEEVLTQLSFLIESSHISKDVNVSLLENLQAEILKFIKNNCKLTFSDKFAHRNFIRKILAARKPSLPRLKVFTLNYDTLFEQASAQSIVVIDGFSFTQPRTFKGTNFDLDIVLRSQMRQHEEENFSKNVMHLYKLHGSIDWEYKDGSVIQSFEHLQHGKGSMIYPGVQKFQESYTMPFFEMIGRFQVATREKDTVLIVIGYSFGDEHINRIIDEALNSNLGLRVYVFSPSSADESSEDASEYLKQLRNQAKNKKLNNLFLVSSTFQELTDLTPDHMNLQIGQEVENNVQQEDKNESAPF